MVTMWNSIRFWLDKDRRNTVQSRMVGVAEDGRAARSDGRSVREKVFGAVAALALFGFGSPVLAELIDWGADRPINEWWLYVGSKSGARDIVDSGALGEQSNLGVNLPANTDVYIRIWYVEPGEDSWGFIDFVHHGENGSCQCAHTMRYGRGFHLVITK